MNNFERLLQEKEFSEMESAFDAVNFDTLQLNESISLSDAYSEISAMIAEAFNSEAYKVDDIIEKGGETSFLFTDDKGDQFRLQFIGSGSGFGKNTDVVYLGKRKGRMFADNIDKLDNPRKLVATFIDVFHQYLLGRGKSKVGFGISLSGKAAPRLAPFLKKVIDKALRSKLKVVDKAYNPVKNRVMVWAYDSTKKPEEIFNGKKITGDAPWFNGGDKPEDTATQGGQKSNDTPAVDIDQIDQNKLKKDLATALKQEKVTGIGIKDISVDSVSKKGSEYHIKVCFNYGNGLRESNIFVTKELTGEDYVKQLVTASKVVKARQDEIKLLAKKQKEALKQAPEDKEGHTATGKVPDKKEPDQVGGKVDNSNQKISKEYQDLKQTSLKELRNEIKRIHKVVNVSEYDKEGAISEILVSRHGSRRVKQYFDSQEPTPSKSKQTSDGKITSDKLSTLPDSVKQFVSLGLKDLTKGAPRPNGMENWGFTTTGYIGNLVMEDNEPYAINIFDKSVNSIHSSLVFKDSPTLNFKDVIKALFDKSKILIVPRSPIRDIMALIVNSNSKFKTNFKKTSEYLKTNLLKLIDSLIDVSSVNLRYAPDVDNDGVKIYVEIRRSEDSEPEIYALTFGSPSLLDKFQVNIRSANLGIDEKIVFPDKIYDSVNQAHEEIFVSSIEKLADIIENGAPAKQELPDISEKISLEEAIKSRDPSILGAKGIWMEGVTLNESVADVGYTFRWGMPKTGEMKTFVSKGFVRNGKGLSTETLTGDRVIFRVAGVDPKATVKSEGGNEFDKESFMNFVQEIEDLRDDWGEDYSSSYNPHVSSPWVRLTYETDDYDKDQALEVMREVVSEINLPAGVEVKLTSGYLEREDNVAVADATFYFKKPKAGKTPKTLEKKVPMIVSASYSDSLGNKKTVFYSQANGSVWAKNQNDVNIALSNLMFRAPGQMGYRESADHLSSEIKFAEPKTSVEMAKVVGSVTALGNLIKPEKEYPARKK